MNLDHLRKGIGAAMIAIGICWAAVLLWPLHDVGRDGGWQSKVAEFVFLPLFASLGAFAVFYGGQLYRRYNERYLQWAIGTAATAGVFFVAGFLEPFLPADIDADNRGVAWLLLEVLVAGSVYLYAASRLLSLFDGRRRSPESMIRRGHLAVLAYLIYGLLRSLFEEFSPLAPGYKYVHEEPWQSLGFIVPAGVAYLFFRLSMWKLRQANKDSQAPH